MKKIIEYYMLCLGLIQMRLLIGEVEFSKIYYNFNGTENEIKTNKFASLSTNYYYRS